MKTRTFAQINVYAGLVFDAQFTLFVFAAFGNFEVVAAGDNGMFPFAQAWFI